MFADIEQNKQNYAGLTIRVPYTFLTSAEMVQHGYKPVQEQNYHSPSGGHRLLVLPPTPGAQGLCFMSSDLISEPDAELGRVDSSGKFTWNNHPKNELTVFRQKPAANVSHEITGWADGDDTLHRVSHSYKKVIKVPAIRSLSPVQGESAAKL
jgi:hypothetical protein